MAQLARSELIEAKEVLIVLEDDIIKALTPRDDADERGIVLEVRAGTGSTIRWLFFFQISGFTRHHDN